MPAEGDWNETVLSLTMFMTLDSVLVVDVVPEKSDSAFIARNFKDVVLVTFIVGWPAGMAPEVHRASLDEAADFKFKGKEAKLVVVVPAPLMLPTV